MANAKTELPMVSRNYKDTVFRKLFSNKEALLHLYNAVMDTNYEELDDLEITDTENPIYIGMRNDVAFVADFQVHLYEHQSTMNPNMPLRDLFYVSQLYGKILGEKNIYSRTPVLLPTPNFIVFYNGIQKHPETLEYRLSDLYVMKKDIPQMELRVRVININAGCNERLVSQCKELKGYQRESEHCCLSCKRRQGPDWFLRLHVSYLRTAVRRYGHALHQLSVHQLDTV